MFHCSVIKVPVVLATAILDYHIFLSLSRTFFIFLKLFSELFPLVSVIRDSQSRLSHLSRSVKHFFQTFLFRFSLLSDSFYKISYTLYFVNNFFHFLFNFQTSKRLTGLYYTTIFPLCQ